MGSTKALTFPKGTLRDPWVNEGHEFDLAFMARVRIAELARDFVVLLGLEHAPMTRVSPYGWRRELVKRALVRVVNRT